MREMSVFRVTLASTVESLMAPLLSCTSSSDTMSGERRLLTISAASASNFACGSVGSRFSTLSVATASWVGVGTAVISAPRPPESAVSGAVRRSLKFENE
jgi:hypothetical protein